MSRFCPACGAPGRPAFRQAASGSELGVSAAAFVPSADRYGATAAPVLRCGVCGHGWVDPMPSPDAVAGAYAGAADPVSLREEAGQVATARRDLARIERFVSPGRMADLGCWTGSFLVAARERGWEPVGVEPSAWASERARARGLDVRTADLASHGLEPGTFRLVAMLDVLEHLADPAAGLASAATLLEPGGALFLALPDAGSRMSRILGRRWWSVLPMHLHYFTRASATRTLRRAGFAVRDASTHPKAFTARYYAERLNGYTPAVARAAVRVLAAGGMDERLVAPDLGDRMAILAVRPGGGDASGVAGPSPAPERAGLPMP